MLLTVISVISFFHCIQFVPTGFTLSTESFLRETIPSDVREIGLPKPFYTDEKMWLVIPSTICFVLFLFKKKNANIVGCIVAFTQVLIAAFFPYFIDLSYAVSASYGSEAGAVNGCFGDRRLSPLGWIELILCIIAFIASVLLTIAFNKENKQKIEPAEPNVPSF